MLLGISPPLWLLIFIVIAVILGWKIIKFAIKFLIAILLILFIVAIAHFLFSII